MAEIVLRPDLAKKLSQEAERRQTSVEALVNDWLEEHWWKEQHTKIREESKRYQAQHPELRAKYADKVVAMLNGEVVEVGDDLGEVYRRVRGRLGDEAVLITRVGEKPVETFTIQRMATARRASGRRRLHRGDHIGPQPAQQTAPLP